MKIEKGKYYLQIQNGYVTDAVSYNPNIKGYNLFETNNLPADIMNQCYQIINGKLVLDEAKYQIFLEEQAAAEVENGEE